MSTTTLLVRQNQLADTAVRTTADSALLEGEIRVQVDRFALTSNNITYAAFGDAMNDVEMLQLVGHPHPPPVPLPPGRTLQRHG